MWSGCLIRLPLGCPSLKAKVLVKAKNLLEGLYIPPDPGAPQGSPGGSWNISGWRKDLNVLINLQPQPDSTTSREKQIEWKGLMGSDWTEGLFGTRVTSFTPSGCHFLKKSDQSSPVPVQCSVMYILV